jgi:hypothetical protein
VFSGDIQDFLNSGGRPEHVNRNDCFGLISNLSFKVFRVKVQSLIDLSGYRDSPCFYDSLVSRYECESLSDDLIAWANAERRQCYFQSRGARSHCLSVNRSKKMSKPVLKFLDLIDPFTLVLEFVSKKNPCFQDFVYLFLFCFTYPFIAGHETS